VHRRNGNVFAFLSRCASVRFRDRLPYARTALPHAPCLNALDGLPRTDYIGSFETRRPFARSQTFHRGWDSGMTSKPRATLTPNQDRIDCPVLSRRSRVATCPLPHASKCSLAIAIRSKLAVALADQGATATTPKPRPLHAQATVPIQFRDLFQTESQRVASIPNVMKTKLEAAD
jgi:hypothetical protein